MPGNHCHDCGRPIADSVTAGLCGDCQLFYQNDLGDEDMLD